MTANNHISFPVTNSQKYVMRGKMVIHTCTESTFLNTGEKTEIMSFYED